MPSKSIPNSFRIEGDTVFLDLINKRYGGQVIATTIVDLSDLDRVLAVGRWTPIYLGKARQMYVYNHPSKILLHRFVMDAPKGVVVDHINHDPLDNRKVNLRLCSTTENNQNRSGPTTSSRVGVRNVWWDRKAKMYRVVVKANNVRHHVGLFADLEEAADAAAEARQKLHLDFAS